MAPQGVGPEAQRIGAFVDFDIFGREEFERFEIAEAVGIAVGEAIDQHIDAAQMEVVAEPRMESWPSSAAPKRGRISTPGTKSRTSCKLAPRDSRISWESTREVPPGTRSNSRRVSSSLRKRSGMASGARG